MGPIDCHKPYHGYRHKILFSKSGAWGIQDVKYAKIYSVLAKKNILNACVTRQITTVSFENSSTKHLQKSTLDISQNINL